MSLIWHMVRTDLYRLRRSLVLWVAVLAATPLFGAFLLWGDGGSEHWFRAMADGGIPMAVAEVLAGLVIVPLLLHSDPVVGHTAFWITRPISRARLWRAKLGGLGMIFGLVPVLVLLPWWLACGYGPREVALASGETLLWQAAIVALALPVAALTQGFSRYFVWLLVVVAAMTTSSVFLLFIPELSTQSVNELIYVWSRAWFALAVFLIGGCVAAVWQFHFRRFAQSFVVLGLTAIVSLTVLGFWPRQLSPRVPAGLGVKPGPIATGIQLTFDQARVEREIQHQNADLVIWVRFTGIPDELLLSAAWDLGRESQQPAEHLWTWGSGLRLGRQGWVQAGGHWLDAEWLALGLNRTPPDTRDWWVKASERRQQNGLPPLVVMDGRWATARVQVPRAFEMRTRLEPPAYRLRLTFDLTRPKLSDERPLKVGETLRAGRTSARVAHLDFDRRHGPDRYSTLLETSPMLLWDAGAASLVPLFVRSWQAEPRYMIVNRARGNAAGSGGGTWGRFGSVRITRRELSQQAPWELQDGKWVTPEGWFDGGVTVAAMTYEWRERFVKEIQMEKFELASPPASGGAK